MINSEESGPVSGKSGGVETAAGKTVMPYGQWESAISVADLFSHANPPMYPFYNKDRLYWLEARSDEGGRIALMRALDDKRICLLPEPFNIRSQVHEYGGNCFVDVGNGIVFNNFMDGCLYLQYFDQSQPPVKLTHHDHDSGVCGYADLIFIEQYSVVVAVCEERVPGQQNENSLISIKVNLLAPQPVSPKKIISGRDFYCSPVVSSDGSALAWIEWDNPYMQWDQSRLMRGQVSEHNDVFCVDRIEPVMDRPECAISQPGFLPDQRLVFASDNEDTDFWNFYVYDAGKITRLTRRDAEVGEAHWVFGQKRWVYVSGNSIIAIETTKMGDQLIRLDAKNDEAEHDNVQDNHTQNGHTQNSHNQNSDVKALHEEFAVCQHLSTNGDDVVFVASYCDRPAEILSLSGSTNLLDIPGPWLSVNRFSSESETDNVSYPVPVSYPTADGEQAHGYFYPPTNLSYCAPPETKPPMIVLVHGGPTSRTTMALAPLKQYLTSLGYALLDINHRGSTGYGRRYRQKLLGKWGEIDASDIADGVAYAISQGWVDEKQIFIRGGSAGGYAVLRALTRYGEIFAGGACYYGIGNLITLCDITHKFEGKYTDRLIGETYNPESARKPESRFFQRSPIFEMDKLVSPLILFQGLKDKVVPPQVSQEVVNMLKKKGIMHDYVEYPEEGHGFRMTETKIDALTRETEFFANIIRHSPGNHS